jgi:hypothetical protein
VARAMTVIKILRSKCCPKTPSPKITRDVREDACGGARALARTEAFEQSCREQTHRDAARSPEAHLATWPTEIARTTWRPVRVHTRSHRPEPAPARQTLGSSTTTGGRALRERQVALKLRRRALVPERRSRRSRWSGRQGLAVPTFAAAVPPISCPTFPTKSAETRIDVVPVCRHQPIDKQGQGETSRLRAVLFPLLPAGG